MNEHNLRDPNQDDFMNKFYAFITFLFALAGLIFFLSK